MNINRSGPLSLRARFGAIFPLLFFASYVGYADYKWFDTNLLFLFSFYVIVVMGTFCIMLAGVFWRSFTKYPPAEGRVLCIVPVYNEEPELYTAAIWSLINQTRPPDVIHVVDDGSKHPLVEFDHPLVIWHHQANQGKRHAQANVLWGYSANQWDFILTVDSDSVCDPDAVEHLLRSMFNPQTNREPWKYPWHSGCQRCGRDHKLGECIQAATGMIFVRNWKKNLLTRLTDINVVTSCLMFRMFRSWMKVVTPTSGALALYRASLVYDNLEDYVSSGTAGDDRRLSFYALLRGGVVGVHESVVETKLPETWGEVFNQRMRWSKSAWLGIPFVLTNLRALPVLLYMYPLAFAMMWPFVLTTLGILWYRYDNPAIWYGFAFLVLVSVTMTSIYALYRPSMTVGQRLGQWALSPIYPILGLIILRPACYMALFHLKSTSWHTRELKEEEEEQPENVVTLNDLLDQRPLEERP